MIWWVRISSIICISRTCQRDWGFYLQTEVCFGIRGRDHLWNCTPRIRMPSFRHLVEQWRSWVFMVLKLGGEERFDAGVMHLTDKIMGFLRTTCFIYSFWSSLELLIYVYQQCFYLFIIKLYIHHHIIGLVVVGINQIESSAFYFKMI